MKRIQIIGLAIVAMLAFSVVAAAAAQAAEGPFYKVETKRLEKGSAEEVEGSAEGAQELETPDVGVKITCETLEVKSGGKIEGSTGKNPGKSKETLVYKKCKVTGDGSSCKVKEPIETNPLVNTLGYEKENREGKLLILFSPESGSVFATIHFEGTCTFGSSTEVKLKGKSSGVICELLNGKKENIEVGKHEEEAEAGFIKCPSTALTTIYVEKEGAIEKKTGGLEVFGFESKYVGTSKVKLKSKKKWGVFT